MDSPRPLLRRPLALVVTALAAVSLLAGCADGGPVGLAPAAVVAGESIPQSKVTDLLEAQRRYYESLDDPAAAERLATFMGAGTDTFAMPSDYHDVVVYEAAWMQAVRQRDQVAITEFRAERDAVLAEMTADGTLQDLQNEWLADYLAVPTIQ